MQRSFLGHAAIYGLANLLVQAGSFVLLPLFLRHLGPSDYGVLEVVGRLAETVSTVLLFGGFRQALMTFYQQADDEAARRRVVSSTLVLVLVSCLAGGVIGLGVGPWLANAFAGETSFDPWVIRLAILGILLDPFYFVPVALLQARVRSLAYLLVVVAYLLVRIGLSVLMVRYLAWGVVGVLAATALSTACFAVVLTIRELVRGGAWPDFGVVKSMLTFALPMLPGGLCFFVLHHGDRFFLLRHCTTAEVGMYALGYKLAMIVAVFSLNPLYMVWSSYMYAAAKRDDGPEVFGRVFVRILAAYLFVGLGLCLFAREVIVVLGGELYLPAVAVVAPVVLACFFQCAATLMDAGMYVQRRTGLKLGVTLVATAVMLALYRVLIPAFGSMGAALATLGGFAFLALVTFLVSQRVYRVSYPWPRIAGALALALLLWFVGQSLPTGGWSIAARGGLWLSAPSIAWFVGLISADEKMLVKESVYRLLARMRRADPLLAGR